MITTEDYRPLSLEDRNLFKEHYLKYPPTHSEYLFTGLASWSHYTPAYFLFRDGALFIMNMLDGKPQLRPPVGERSKDVLDELLDFARRAGGEKAFIAIDESAKKWIQKTRPEIRITPDRDFFDYIYLARNLAELPGKAYLTQRNHLNRFRKRYDYAVEKINAENIREITEFLNRWCLARDCEGNLMLDEEKKAILFCMEHYFELELSGLIIRIDGKVQALSVWEEMNNDTAAIHFEKAMPEYEGIYPAINNEAAKAIEKDYKYINRESDLGIPGLRTAKERLHPHHMEPLYYIKREDL